MFQTLDILIFIISLVGITGNGIVLWLLGFKLHRNAFSDYILNLAGADFLFLCLQNIIHSHVHKIYIPRYLFILILPFFHFTYLSGLSIISAVSAERCLSVWWPIWYRCRRPRHTSAVVCALLWTLSLLLILLDGKPCGLFYSNFDYDLCKKLNLVTFAWLITLIVVLLGSSLALVVRIFCGSQRMLVTRLYVTLTFTVLVFILFGLPYGINWFFLFWFVDVYSVIPCNVYKLTTFMSCVNSSANPIIYFLVGSIRHHRFQRQTLKMLLQRAMQDTPEEEGGERGSLGKSGELETI